MLYGGASYWNDMTGILAVEQEVAKYVKDDKVLKSLPEGFLCHAQLHRYPDGHDSG